jgi:hypothetical protein
MWLTCLISSHRQVNYDNRLEVQTCQLLGLAELVLLHPPAVQTNSDGFCAYSLATDTEYVRATLAQYGNDLLSLGVDGFRLDAAKSENSCKALILPWNRRLKRSDLDIPTSDIANILSRLTSTPFITQEVIWGAGQPITPAEYVQNGNVQEYALLPNAHNG